MTSPMTDDAELESGWLKHELRAAERSYRAIEFARLYPEIVNSIADELGFVAKEPLS